MGVIRHLDSPRDLRLGDRPLGRALGVDDGFLALDLLPFEALLAAVGVEALAVLPGGVEQTAGDLRDHIRVLDGEGRGLDGERAPVATDELLANPARPVAD